MGLTSWTGALPKRTDAEVAKNYLSADELDTLNRIVSLYLDFAELQAKSHQPMYMKDWIQKLDDFLKLSGKELLTHAGRISAEIAKQKADMEYDKFKVRTANELTPVEIHFIENFEKEQKKIEAMKNIQYQQKAVSELVEKTIGLLSLSGNRHTLVFKAPTGSGKTVMASEMLMRLNDELAERPDAPFTEVAYIWIAPNKLHEQSYFKMKNHFTETKILRPVIYDELDHSIEGYIRPGEILFVNWESINKENAVMVRETELSASLYDITRRTQEDNGIPIIVIIDEEHMFGSRNAKKSEKVLGNICPKVEIRISATPLPESAAKAEEQVTVPRERVIAEQMIKESVILNPALAFNPMLGTLNQQLISLALKKREELAEAYRKEGVNINPLLLIQLPNDGETMTGDDNSVKGRSADLSGQHQRHQCG